MSLILPIKWRVIDKVSSKTICILTATKISDMFWFDGEVTPDELFDKYYDEFIAVSDLNPNNNTDLGQLDEALNNLAEKLRYEAIDHELEIEDAILYIFADKKAYFRVIWKD